MARKNRRAFKLRSNEFKKERKKEKTQNKTLSHFGKDTGLPKGI